MQGWLQDHDLTIDWCVYILINLCVLDSNGETNCLIPPVCWFASRVIPACSAPLLNKGAVGTAAGATEACLSAARPSSSVTTTGCTMDAPASVARPWFVNPSVQVRGNEEGEGRGGRGKGGEREGREGE